jgi:hypothetical protein
MSSLVLGVLHLLGATGAAVEDGGWLSRNSTLVVGVVGIVFSGFVGPTVVAHFAARRELAKDARALAVARQDDLRSVLDEAAQVLSGAVGQLRPLLAAALAGNDLPQEPADFLGSLAPLGHRLCLRLPDDDPVVASYNNAVECLRAVASATTSQAAFDAAVLEFEAARDGFLADSRAKLREDVFEDKNADKAKKRQ